MLPIIPASHWKPSGETEPVVRILLLLTTTIGLPYFVLSATGPLIQRWFSLTFPDKSPYRLYALSNAGSLLALLSYPLVFEPAFNRKTQAWIWSASLAAFALLCIACARRLAASAGERSGDSETAPSTGVAGDPASDRSPTAGNRVLWVGFASIASVLLIATTNQLSQDIAVIPFLWVLPLVLYLLSFILCFDHPRWYRRGLFAGIFVMGTVAVCRILYAESGSSLAFQISSYSVTLFAACMICHGELYRMRPAPRFLTSFYLHLAAGGAFGGLLVAVVAPLLLDRYAELQAGLWALSYLLGVVCLRDRDRTIAEGAAIAALVSILLLPAFWIDWTDGISDAFATYPDAFGIVYRKHWPLVLAAMVAVIPAFADGWHRMAQGWRTRMGGFVMFLSVGLGIFFIIQLHHTVGTTLAATRNFYGTLRVYEELPDREYGWNLKLVHGVITHGLQFGNPVQSRWPTTYYGEASGVGLAIKHLRRPEGQRHIGLVGLGTGTLAVYGRKGDQFRIYEINPDVVAIARKHFTFLSECEAHVQVIAGDARLSMEVELKAGTPQGFDLLVLDAFSSDSIPIHLLTREVMEVYLRHLREDGILAVHVSNRYLDLQPVVEKLAETSGLVTATINDDSVDSWWIYRTKWMLLARDSALLSAREIQDKALPRSEKTGAMAVWTDDHASLVQILR
ncbi:MAG: fused MFS/spermidine synthase [Opitutaceae bacterium]|nr:fused MFS/spermidine synthase [Opitutaceae bacterium]